MIYQYSTDIDGIIGYSDKIIYVKIDEQGNSIPCTQDEAQLIVFDNKVYNYPPYMMKNNNQKFDPEAPVIYIAPRDGAQIIFQKGKVIEKTTDDLGNLEIMTCDMDASNEERFSNIEGMLCDIDAQINA